MILHPSVSDISARRDRIVEAVRKGHLTPELSRYARPGWAYVLKDRGVPELAFPEVGNYFGEDSDEGTVSYVITTDDEDRDGDVVLPSGCSLTNYAKNPVVFFGHQEKPIPIGVCRSSDGRITVYPEENRVVATVHFDREDPDADFIYGKCRRKVLNATSIAFVPIEAERRSDFRKARTHGDHQDQPPGWLFRRWDKTELSVVGVPSNPKAVGLEKELMGACRDVWDRERGDMSPRLRKGWRPYVAQAKGCWGGWCPLPGDEKDLGGGVVLKAVKKSAEPDPEMSFAAEVRKAGEELAVSTDPAPMPGYGQIFRGPDNQLWYVGGDGDDDGFADLVVEKLGQFGEVTYEAEGFPPKDEGWEQLYPEQKLHKKAACSCSDCAEGKACPCGKSADARVKALHDSAAYKQGAQDARAGKPSTANPHPRGTFEHLEWYAGWEDVDDETHPALQKSRHPFKVEQRGEDWYVLDGRDDVGGPFDSAAEAHYHAAKLWREQSEGADRAEKRIAKSARVVVGVSSWTPDEVHRFIDWMGENTPHGSSPEGWDGKRYTKVVFTAGSDSETGQGDATLNADIVAGRRAVGKQVRKQVECSGAGCRDRHAKERELVVGGKIWLCDRCYAAYKSRGTVKENSVSRGLVHIQHKGGPDARERLVAAKFDDTQLRRIVREEDDVERALERAEREVFTGSWSDSRMSGGRQFDQVIAPLIRRVYSEHPEKSMQKGFEEDLAGRLIPKLAPQSGGRVGLNDWKAGKPPFSVMDEGNKFSVNGSDMGNIGLFGTREAAQMFADAANKIKPKKKSMTQADLDSPGVPGQNQNPEEKAGTVKYERGDEVEFRGRAGEVLSIRDGYVFVQWDGAGKSAVSVDDPGLKNVTYEGEDSSNSGGGGGTCRQGQTAASTGCSPKKALSQSDGRIGGYTVPPEKLDDPETPGWAACEGCHGDGNCEACGGTGTFGGDGECPECGGSGECGECAGEGHVEKSVKKMYAIRNRRNGKLWADEAGWQASGGMVAWFDSVQEAQRTIDEEFVGSTPPPPPLEIVDESGKVAKSYRRKQLDPSTEEQPAKPSAPQVLAALYSHAKAEAAYLDGLGEEHKGSLADYRRQQVEERMDMLKYQFSRAAGEDDDLEKMCKAFEDEHDKDLGPDSVVEPGEAGLVEQGRVPPEQEKEQDYTDPDGWTARWERGPQIGGGPEVMAYFIYDPNGRRQGGPWYTLDSAKRFLRTIDKKRATGKTMKQDQVPAEGAYTEGEPFSKAAPGTDEWAEEEAAEPDHKAAEAEELVVEEKAGSGVCMCGMEVPEDASECPGCGAPVEKTELPLEDEVPVGEGEALEAVSEETPPPVDKDDTAVTDPAAEEILERYQHPKTLRWSTRKHRVSKSLLPFLKYRKAANGQKYLVRAKQAEPEETLDDSEVKALTAKLAGAIDDLKALVRAKDLPRQYKAGLKHVADQIWYVGKALTDKGKEQKNGGSGSELSDKGKEQRDGGKGSELKDKGEQQGKTPTKGYGGKNRGNDFLNQPADPVVVRKFEETMAKLKRFGIPLNGSV